MGPASEPYANQGTTTRYHPAVLVPYHPASIIP